MTTFAGKTRRARKRAEWRARVRPEGPASTSPPPIAVEDPLLAASRRSERGSLQIALMVGAALLAHVAVLGLISAAGTLAARLGEQPDDEERIEVAVVEKAPEPPPPVEPPIEPPAPEPEAPKPEPKPVPKPKPKPKPEPEPVEAAPPVPDPVDRPKDPPPSAPDQPEPRRIVGLNLESTVSGGSGPGFATGNTRMGTTEKQAENPTEVVPIPKNVEESPVNRAATRIPVAGAKVVAPKKTKRVIPEYPEQFRQQGIEAAVVVRVAIDANGRPTKVDIIKASEYAPFNEAARNAALREEYAPATRDGAAIQYSVTFTVTFRLNE